MKRIIKLAMSFSLVFLLFPVSIVAGEIIEVECTGESVGSKTLFILLDTDGGKTNVMGTDLDLNFTKDKAILTNVNEPGQMILDFKSGNLIVNGEKLAFCKFSNLEALGMENTEDAASDAEKVEQEKTNILVAVSEDKEVEIIQLLESMKTQLDKIEAKLDVIKVQGKENTVDDFSNTGESKDQRLGVYEVKCGLVIDDGQYAINPTQLINPIMFDDLTEGDWAKGQTIAINALVNGNGNQAIFNGRAYYRKTGNMIELITLNNSGSPSFNFTTNVSAEQFQEHFGLFPTITCGAG